MGAERTVTNVAAGQLSATSTDAVNGSQLFATDQAVNTLSATVTANKTHYYSVNDGGTQGANYNNDGASGTDALAAGVGALASGVSSTAMGNGAQAQANNALALGLQATASVVGGVAIGSGSVSSRAVLPGVGSIANGGMPSAARAETVGHRPVVVRAPATTQLLLPSPDCGSCTA